MKLSVVILLHSLTWNSWVFKQKDNADNLLSFKDISFIHSNTISSENAYAYAI